MNENAETPLIPSPPQTERAFRLVVEYDGTRYCGWQRQENAPSVQQTLEDTLARITRHPLVIPGAGRTDTGVHAAGQVACLRTTAMDINERSILRGGNTLLPPDIRIVSVESCDPLSIRGATRAGVATATRS
jgi:tRNA pseudouridine38-40 synthase